MKNIRIRIRRREDARDLPLPRYMTGGSSGMDLYADVSDAVVLMPGKIAMVSTGIMVSIPEGFEAEIRPRSGLALKFGVTLVNTPGTIDSDYRGIISLIMINHGNEPFIIRRGDRVAQLVVKEVVRAELVESDKLDETVRAAGGFGHSGV
jgi:dUTP pyrophosphatase